MFRAAADSGKEPFDMDKPKNSPQLQALLKVVSGKWAVGTDATS